MLMNKKGFTLVETLFVLFIICLLSIFSFSTQIPSIDDKTVIKNLTQLIYQSKMNAMLYKERTTLSFNYSQLSITSSHMNKEYTLPNHLHFSDYTFTFNESGHIKTAKRVKLYSSNKSYDFVFQIGSGSFYVE